jgi:GTP-binding protein YchF
VDLGIIGLELSGKTTVFNAVTRGHARTGTFGAAEPNIGVVKIPDERLDQLCAILKPRKVTHAETRYLDFPGALALRGEGPAGSYLAALSQCDALVHVVRAFRDESVPHPEGSVDPHRDIASVNLELAFADAAVLQRRHDRLEIAVRSAKAGEREAGERELSLIQRLREALERDEPLRAQELSPDERRLISGYQLLTDRPLLVLANVDEADIARAPEVEAELAERWKGPGVEVATLCGKLEQELTELSDDDAAEFRQDLGLKEGGLEQMLRLSQRVLGLITFFTVNEPEGRAWPLPGGSTALEAAGKVHTDMARGFIRAEAIGWQDLTECGSLAEARKRGLLRTEGKQYVVQDGDLLHILFNV